jgi:drug/metabolite transporter (DMT)-like permease
MRLARAHGGCEPGEVPPRAWVLLGVLAALWGASYMFIKVALDDLSPAALVFGRTALGALVLAPVAIRRGALAPARRHLGTLIFVAAVQIAGPFALIAAGERSIPSSLAGILVASAPIWTSLLAVAFVPSERLQGIGLVGVAIGIVGVALLFGLDLGGGDALLGGGMILLASLGYAIGALVAKRRLADVPAVGLVASIMTISALMVLPFALFSLPSSAPGLDTAGAMLALGAGGTGIAFLIFYVLNAELGPSRASIVAYIAPGFSVAYGVALLDEAFTTATAAGLALILLGSWLAATGRVPRRFTRSGPSRSTAPAPAHAP